MGTFAQRIEIAASPTGPFESIEALVDTGATYTWLPSSFLRRLGVAPIDKQQFITADDRIIEREVGEAIVRIDDRTRTNVVIFGDEGSQPLLGAFILESFGLAADPVNQRLVPVPGYLVGLR